MAEPFLTVSACNGAEPYRWAPPLHPDVTLFTPVQAPEADRAGALPLPAPVPVWAMITYNQISTIRTYGFAIATSPRAVLVQTTWQGRLQEVFVTRDNVTHRKLKQHDQRK